MQPLRITLSPRARRQTMLVMAATAVGGVVVAVLSLRLMYQSWVTVVVACLTAFNMYYFTALATSYTECTPDHIRTRRLALPRVTPWSQVRDIACGNDSRRRNVYHVQLTTTEGKTYWLGAITTTARGGEDGDPEFADQLKQIVDYWHAVTGAQVATD